MTRKGSPIIVATLFAGAILGLPDGAHSFGSGDDRGSAGFKGLLLAPGARIAALGGAVVALPRNTTSIRANPASVATLTTNEVSLSATDYVLDILPVGGTIVHPSRYGVWSCAVHSISYGDFQRVDQSAGEQGTFDAGDVAVHLGWSRCWGHGISSGLAVGWVRSSIAEYSASAIVASLGFLWELNDGNTVLGFAATDVGGALSSYVGGDQGLKDDVPSTFHLGVMHRPAHFPVPLSLLGDLSLPRDNEATLSVGAEARPVDPLTLRVGYNSLVRYVSSLGPDNARVRRVAFDDRHTSGFGGLGLSFGTGIFWKGFGLDYAYSLAGPFGGTHQISTRYLW